MVCGGVSHSSRTGSVPVYLNVYDLSAINGYAYWVGIGVYHSGVEVHGIEYAYGAHEYSTTGIFEGEPKKCDGFRFRKSILIGKTEMEAAEVRKVMEQFAQFYRGNAYNLITQNCNHFCNDACLLLTRNPIPNWINRLARIGFLCNCVLPATLSSIKVRNHVKAEEKACTVEEKEEQPNQQVESKASDSSSSSSSPPPETFRRGRSRTRRALPPPSPVTTSSLKVVT